MPIRFAGDEAGWAGLVLENPYQQHCSPQATIPERRPRQDVFAPPGKLLGSFGQSAVETTHARDGSFVERRSSGSFVESTGGAVTGVVNCDGLFGRVLYVS